MITYLQHTDPALPHYKAEAWTFPRGALCTIDRNWLGPVGPYLFHGISETHVLHHVSSKIPHYNAWEATEALKARLGKHYVKSTENVFVSLWKSINTCKFVDENDQVAFYRTVDGVPHRIVSPDSTYASDSGIAMSSKCCIIPTRSRISSGEICHDLQRCTSSSAPTLFNRPSFRSPGSLKSTTTGQGRLRYTPL